MSDDQQPPQNNVVDFVAVKQLTYRGYDPKAAIQIEDSWRKADPGYDKGVAVAVENRQTTEEAFEHRGNSARRLKEIEEHAEARHAEWLRQQKEDRDKERDDRDRERARAQEREKSREAHEQMMDRLEKERRALERKAARRPSLASPPLASPPLDPWVVEAALRPSSTPPWFLVASGVAILCLIYFAARPRRAE